jgi:hypothetical protein
MVDNSATITFYDADGTTQLTLSGDYSDKEI